MNKKIRCEFIMNEMSIFNNCSKGDKLRATQKEFLISER